ncbi:hypothetical protein CVT24_006805 [Panaeolus cyanescens]|uniref:Palmitoyltransferase n=1 Tax=Panaeolus cyanescens TaxID=181874 RepID=A0A409VDQ5_9AGAR|nr:hypothetical protein CVT24_006805 [Panaeolus cyanescens]
MSSKRNSNGSNQLPLPTSITLQKLPASPIRTARLASDFPSPNSPLSQSYPLPLSISSPTYNNPYHPSSTHTSGIQPSASFFRPSRPNYQPSYSRPSSPNSLNNGTNTGDQDVFHLTPIGNHHMQTQDSTEDYHIAESVNGGHESGMDESHNSSSQANHPPLAQTNQFGSLKRIKQSREPLLPLSSRHSHSAEPSNSRNSQSNRHTPAHSMSASQSNPLNTSRSATRLVRNSIDKVFSISRGISFDSIRKSATRTPEGRPTFESKITDEEQAHPSPSTPRSPYRTSGSHSNSPHRRKNSLGGPHQAHRIGLAQSPLDLRHSRNSAMLSTHTRTSMHTVSQSPSPDPSFIPVPPPVAPGSHPLSAVPVINPATGKPFRKYQLHPSRNGFLFGGRLLTGGDTPWAFLASFAIWLVIGALWFGTTAVWWWHEESPAVAAVGAYMALLTISCMLATASSDPGILPRNLDPDPPYPASSPSDGGVRAPLPRDLKVRTDVVRVKYCPTCKIYRPPRSSHCKMCDNCVDDCDHHCQWVNNCVGRRNYTTFFILLLSATLTCILIICTSAIHLYLATHRSHNTFRQTLATGQGIGSAIVFCLSISVVWPIGALLSYHMRLLLLNITTIEQIRNQAHKSLMPGPAPPNPFSHGSWRRNIINVLGRPQGFSWLDARGIVTEDRREVNPGLIPEEMEDEGGH